ncbi:testis-specific serine/threonine-protein kinase 1-like [Macrosteles quadrilineatus]|uniref:testis-specific serine/threonine-protein kinase 1-like n=1 Tax=Macrosteles quadrilineatus TaxID=74068 RepID=UPI0023E326CC|nr:testis-specific serine/threonine-protein kinase 1-like [Macrosteles quadrilineatus]
MAPVEFGLEQYHNEMNLQPSRKQLTKFLESQGYKLGPTVGEGSYSRVKSGIKICPDGTIARVACKVINKRKASQDFINRFLPREIEIIRNLEHPNLLGVYDVFESPDQVFIFTNYCERGDLLDYIKRKGALPNEKAKRFFSMLVSAIHYLHSQDISHRDVKCENIFITANEHIMLGDFGFARSCRDPATGSRILSDTFCGSAAYAAPEILQGTPYNPKMYDVWSLGCVLYIMLTGVMPFDDSNITLMLQTQQQKRFPIHQFNLRISAIQLINRMLEPDVTRRATINQVSQSLWLNEQINPMLYTRVPY